MAAEPGAEKAVHVSSNIKVEPFFLCLIRTASDFIHLPAAADSHAPACTAAAFAKSHDIKRRLQSVTQKLETYQTLLIKLHLCLKLQVSVSCLTCLGASRCRLACLNRCIRLPAADAHPAQLLQSPGGVSGSGAASGCQSGGAADGLPCPPPLRVGSCSSLLSRPVIPNSFHLHLCCSGKASLFSGSYSLRTISYLDVFH